MNKINREIISKKKPIQEESSVRGTIQQMRTPSLSSSTNQTPAAKGGGRRGGDGCSGKKVEAATPCCSKVGLKRGPWTAEEDKLLSDYIRREGEGRWRTLPKKAGLLRCGKSCRLRWMNYLRPSVKRGHISSDEEDLILRLHRLLGNRWSLIAGRIPGRTDNEIKNYWNTHLSKKLISQGIDPKTHKPFLLNPKPSESAAVDYNSASKYVIPTFDPQDAIGGKMDNIVHDEFVVHHEDGSKKEVLVGNFDDQGISMSTNNEDGDHADDDHMMINCCPDDAFSSFLNSLINDDMFNSPQHQDDDDQDHKDKSCLI